MNELLMQLLTSCDYVPELIEIQKMMRIPKTKAGPEVKGPDGRAIPGRVKYKYRDLEDIYECLKPLLEAHRCNLMFREFQFVHGQAEQERAYKYSVAILVNKDGKKAVGCSPVVEILNSRMDPAQVSGSVTTYARKNALQGLLLLDNTPEENNIDSPVYQDKREKAQPARSQQPAAAPVTPRRVEDNPRYKEAARLISEAKRVVDLSHVQNNYRDVWTPALQGMADVKYYQINDFGI